MTGDVRTDGTVDEQHREQDERPTEPRTGPVRIIGAHRAGGPVADDAPQEGHVEPEEEPAGFGPEDWSTPSEPSLPHWTEAPTGEVPAVLSRAGSGDDEDPWSAVPEPSWREEHADWDRVDSLDAALWAGAGEGRSLSEQDAAEREPWAFELEGEGAGTEYSGEREDLFASWDNGAAAQGSRWDDETGGARWSGEAAPPGEARDYGAAGGRDEPVVLSEDDLDAMDDDAWEAANPAAGAGLAGPGHAPHGEARAPEDDAWDPDAVAGEKTSVMHLPGPPEPRDVTGELPPPPRFPGGTAASGADLGLAGLHAGVAPDDDVMDPRDPLAGVGATRTGGGTTGDDAGLAEPEHVVTDDELAEEALASDLEARRGRRRWSVRGIGPTAPGGAGPTGLAPHAPTGRGPAGQRRRTEGAGPRPRVGGAALAGHPGGRRAEDAMSQRAGRNLPAAIASGVAIGVLALVAFHFGTVPTMVVVTAVIGLAAMEAFAAFRRAGYHPATLLGLVAVVGLVVGTYDKTSQALPLVTVLLVAGTFVWHLVGVDRRAEPVRSTAATLLVYAWVGVFGSFAALLLAPSLFPDRHGIAYLLGALIAAVAYDVGALTVGAWIGRRPLSPVSPGKTWEGVIGGAVAAVVFSVALVHLIHPWTISHSLLLGVVVAIVSPLGDLCESMVKRRLGLKDMGRILPGHGGLLDRVDGLLFVLPATFYLVRAFHGG